MGPTQEPNKKYGPENWPQCQWDISYPQGLYGLYLDVSWTHSYYKFMVVFATFYPTFPTPSPTHPYLT